MGRSDITRRAAIGRFGVLVGTALWPGVLRAQGKPTGAGPVRFVVLNDLHHENAECEVWFEALFKAAGAHARVAFVAGLGDLANTGKRESLAAIKRLSATARVPFVPVPGNHDNDLEETTRTPFLCPSTNAPNLVIHSGRSLRTCSGAPGGDQAALRGARMGIHGCDWRRSNGKR